MRAARLYGYEYERQCIAIQESISNSIYAKAQLGLCRCRYIFRDDLHEGENVLVWKYSELYDVFVGDWIHCGRGMDKNIRHSTVRHIG